MVSSSLGPSLGIFRITLDGTGDAYLIVAPKADISCARKVYIVINCDNLRVNEWIPPWIGLPVNNDCVYETMSPCLGHVDQHHGKEGKYTNDRCRHDLGE